MKKQQERTYKNNDPFSPWGNALKKERGGDWRTMHTVASNESPYKKTGMVTQDTQGMRQKSGVIDLTEKLTKKAQKDSTRSPKMRTLQLLDGTRASNQRFQVVGIPRKARGRYDTAMPTHGRPVKPGRGPENPGKRSRQITRNQSFQDRTMHLWTDDTKADRDYTVRSRRKSRS